MENICIGVNTYKIISRIFHEGKNIDGYFTNVVRIKDTEGQLINDLVVQKWWSRM